MVLSKAKRLSKVAREFNVGISTIVEFLNGKGYELDGGPNAKVSPECYNLLIQEYSNDIEVKKEKEKITLRSHSTRKETVTLKVEETVNERESQAEDIVIIQDNSGIEEKDGFKEKEKKKTVKTEELIENVKVENKAEVKVVGKIDLDKNTKKEEKKEEAEVAKEEGKQEVVEEKVETSKEKIEAVVELKEEVKEEVVTEEKKDDTEVKVIGKIDLSTLNQKTRPKKKTKEEKQQERKAKKETVKKEDIVLEVKEKKAKKEHVVKKEIVEVKKTEIVKEVVPKKIIIEGRKEEFIETKVKKLNGPTVVGKIELPVKEEKKQISNLERKKARKKKRKRIVKEPVNVDKTNQSRFRDRNDKSKTQKRGKRIQKKEVDDGEVQKQIKETLARLTSKGKSKGVKHRREKREEIRSKHQAKLQAEADEKQVIKVTEFVTANELSTMMDVAVTKIIEACMNLGMFVSINQRLDAETISLVAEEFGYGVEFISAEVQDAIIEEIDKDEDLIERPPIVTVMGHVDHGKTSLLDYIRSTNIIAGEAGGITQHIGAYNVTLKNGKRVTFLDTPGHEAFTAMRARGAQVTDLAIIVVASDDKVMPQTVEAINHAVAAGVPIVFAINKIDSPNSNPEKIKEQLASMNYLVEDWGGKYQSKDISAKTGERVDDLMEEVFLATELLELKANPNKKAVGTIIESSLDKGRGFVATVLVSSGTLRVGDVMLAGAHYGKVKAIFNERNQKIDKIGPAEPGVVLGLDGAPNAGDSLNGMSSDREAREIATKREQLQREQNIRTSRHITLDEIGRRIAIGNFQELNIIVKGDVDGSVEALSDSLLKQSTDEVQVNIIHKAVGQIAESDVMLAAASNAIIIGFQVRPSLGARRLAEKEDLEIRLYSIIYDAINEIKDAITGMLAPKMKEEITAMVEVMEVFKITKVGTVAGCMVRDGKINRNANIRVIRDGIVVYTGALGSLKRFKDDVKEVAKGFDCGLNIEKYNDIKVGDVVEAYHDVEVKRV